MLIGDGVSTSEATTEELGRALGAALDAPVAWCLSGELGSGKTVLARGLLHGLGIRGAVRSPTFTLAIPYRGRLPAVHVDLYRLEDAAAAEMLGWDDWLDGQAVLIVEWGERARALIGPERIDVVLEHRGESERAIRIEATTGVGERLGSRLTAAWEAVGPSLV